MKALVLSGGKGTRLRPLTYTMAKQLIPVANRPILLYVMQQVRDAGIADIGVVVSPETGSQIEETLERECPDLSLTYIVQDEPGGLAHAVKVAQDYLEDEPFVMYLGDNLVGSGTREFIEAFYTSRADAVVLLKQVDDPRMFGVAEVDGDGRVLRLVEKPKDPKSDLALVGVYVFSAAIHQAIAETQPSARGELEITDAIQRLLERGRTVVGFMLPGFWLDTGTRDDLLEANRVALDEWVTRDVAGDVDAESRVLGQVAVGQGARIAKSQVRGPAIIGPGATIEASSVGPYASVGAGCVVSRSRIERCVLMDGVTVEGVDSLDGSVLGRRAVVRSLDGARPALRLMIGDDSEVLL